MALKPWDKHLKTSVILTFKRISFNSFPPLPWTIANVVGAQNYRRYKSAEDWNINKLSLSRPDKFIFVKKCA